MIKGTPSVLSTHPPRAPISLCRAQLVPEIRASLSSDNQPSEGTHLGGISHKLCYFLLPLLQLSLLTPSVFLSHLTQEDNHVRSDFSESLSLQVHHLSLLVRRTQRGKVCLGHKATQLCCNIWPCGQYLQNGPEMTHYSNLMCIIL